MSAVREILPVFASFVRECTARDRRSCGTALPDITAHWAMLVYLGRIFRGHSSASWPYYVLSYYIILWIILYYVLFHPARARGSNKFSSGAFQRERFIKRTRFPELDFALVSDTSVFCVQL